MNPSGSNFKGPIFVISIPKEHEYHFKNGTSSFALRCDGKYRPAGHNSMQSCVTSGAGSLDLTTKVNGAKTRATHWQLSADGTVLTTTVITFGPNGPVVTGGLTAARITGSNAFAGQWRDVSATKKYSTMTLKLDSQQLHIGYPSAGEFIDAPLNGTDASAHGSHASAFLTFSVRFVGRDRFLMLAKRNGQVRNETSFALSDDGMSIRETWRNPGEPEDKRWIVFDRK